MEIICISDIIYSISEANHRETKHKMKGGYGRSEQLFRKDF